MAGFVAKRLEDLKSEIDSRITYYNNDWNGRRKISVRGEYLTKIRLFTRKLNARRLAAKEDNLREREVDNIEDRIQLDKELEDVSKKKLENARKMVEHEERLKEIEKIKQEKEKEKAEAENIAQPDVNVITSTPDVQSDIQSIPEEGVEPTAIEPVVSNPEEAQQPKNIDVPFVLSDEQINNMMNGVQQMMDNQEGGNNIQNETTNNIEEQFNNIVGNNTIENTIDEVQAGMAQDVQKIQQTEEVDTLVQKFEQPGISFNDDMNAVMKQFTEQITDVVKKYVSEISNVSMLEVAKKQNEIDNLLEERRSNNVQIHNLTVESAKKDERISTLEKERETYETRIKNGMDAVAEKDAKIAELEGKIKILESQGQQMMSILNQIQELQQQSTVQNEEPAPQKVNAIN